MEAGRRGGEEDTGNRKERTWGEGRGRGGEDEGEVGVKGREVREERSRKGVGEGGERGRGRDEGRTTKSQINKRISGSMA